MWQTDGEKEKEKGEEEEEGEGEAGAAAAAAAAAISAQKAQLAGNVKRKLLSSISEERIEEVVVTSREEDFRSIRSMLAGCVINGDFLTNRESCFRSYVLSRWLRFKILRCFFKCSLLLSHGYCVHMKQFKDMINCKML